MSDSILVRVTLGSYDIVHPSAKQTQVYVQIPEVARATWLLPEDHFQFSKSEPWPGVVDSAQEHYRQRGMVSDSASEAARKAVVEWLLADANHDAMYEAWEQDQARQNPVARKLLKEHEQLRARVVALEEQRDRRRVRLIAAESDLLNVRGLLSPAGEPRRIPADIQIHERVAPAIEWLLNRIVELEARLDEARARVAESDRPVDEDPIAYELTTLADDEAVRPQVERLRALLAGRRAVVEADGITQRIAPTQALRAETGGDQ
ncbi:hypothetical protein [Streptomyces leeuwenhoekii]|uniref:hypothetical protein n=1 Tax=Streptomyces leeuwenhoekii TaxID=1437453 RepID=UPI00065C9FE2|nr:hypothetical protein [Streptomyces leeuwenhoekii]